MNMNLVLLGPQGSGKGTQAEMLVKKYGMKRFEMGKIFRQIAESDHANAQEIKKVIDGGGLAPDALTNFIAWDYVSKHDPENSSFLFDGFPRTLVQYRHLQEQLNKSGRKIDLVFNINISKNESIRRLSARRTCIKCNKIYNLITDPPSKKVCECGGELIQRDDDTSEAIKKRLELYQQFTKPVIELARQEGKCVDIDGEQSIEKVDQDILAEIESFLA